MKQINGYIGFNGKCREAMTFYHECFGGDLVLSTIEGSPIENMCPPAMKDQIMNSSLILPDGNILVMGSDMTGPWGHIDGNNVSLLINCTSEEEINRLYTKLSEGGKIKDELKVQFWGDLFGVFEDRFGTNWMVIYSKNENQ